MEESQSKDFEFRSQIDLDTHHQPSVQRFLVFEIEKKKIKDEDLWIHPGFGHSREKK